MCENMKKNHKPSRNTANEQRNALMFFHIAITEIEEFFPINAVANNQLKGF
jgi:hypothetical protein